MPNFRRYYIPNAVVFITCNTKNRLPYLQAEDDVELFFNTLHRVQEIHSFRLLAYVILPNHFHWLLQLENDESNFSTIMHSTKRNFTLNYKEAHSIDQSFKLWQARFWDHVIRNENDLQNHFDYIHWNPVKHGYVASPDEWPHSTFMHWFKQDFYKPGWGYGNEPTNIVDMNLE